MFKSSRSLLKVFLGIVFCSFVSAASAADQKHLVVLQQPEFSITVGPYLQGPAQDSMTVMWLTSGESTSWVEYGSDKNNLDKKAVSVKAGLIDAGITLHKIRITGLQPGRKYFYRACSKHILKFGAYKVKFGRTVKSDIYDFCTLDPKKKSISFVVFNDIHENVENFKARFELIKNKPFDLVFLNGDHLSTVHSEQQIVDKLLKPCTELFAHRVPFILVRGNHETRGSFSRMLSNYVDYPQQRYYYSFDDGPVHFVILDSGEDKEDSHWAYSGMNSFDGYRDQQKIWLEKEIRSRSFRKAKFRVCLTHIPFFKPKDWYGPAECRRKWMGLLNKGKIDLHISGHTHKYEILQPKRGEHCYPVVIGGGPKKGQGTVTCVAAGKKKITVQVLDDTGKTIGTLEVKKKNRSLLGLLGL